MALKIPKQSFLALAAVAWADGSLRPEEGKALVRAAKECGLDGEDLAAVEKATKEKVELASFDASGLSAWEQVLTYALASWLATLDGVVSTTEHDSLVALGEKLGLTPHLRARATAVAFDISVLPQGGRPDKYDFVKLEARLREKLPQISGT